MLASLFVPAVAVPIVGAPGTAQVVTLFDALLAADVPISFVAVTVNVYAVPFDKPLTEIGDDAPVPVRPPGLEVTVYPVMVLPPLNAGGVNVRLTVPTPVFDAVPTVGASGTVGTNGHSLAFAFAACWLNVQTPDAVPSYPPVVVGGVLVMKPPSYWLDIRHFHP